MFFEEYFEEQDNKYKMWSMVEYSIVYKEKIKIDKILFIEQNKHTMKDVYEIFRYWNKLNKDKYKHEFVKITMNLDKHKINEEFRKRQKFMNIIQNPLPYNETIKIIML